jgi:tetratricopeptide (TPR) repeat protein
MWPLVKPVIICFIFALVFMRLFRDRWFVFAWAFFLVKMFVLLGGDYRYKHWVGDRFMYVPSLILCYYIGLRLDEILVYLKSKTRFGKNLLYCAITAVFLLLSYKTFTQCRIWNNSIALWEYAAPHSPYDDFIYNNLAEAYMSYDLKKSWYYADKSIQINSNYDYAYNNRGLASMELGRLEEALSDFDRAILISPKYLEAYNNRGVVYYRMGRYDAAMENFNKALSLNPNYHRIYTNIGLVHVSEGKYELAIQDFNKTLMINPYLADVYFNRGLAYELLGDDDKASADYHKATTIDPRHKESYNNLGLMYTRQGKFKEAIEQFGIILKIDPSFLKAYNNLGLVYYKQKDFKSAIRVLDEVIRIAPNYPEAYKNRGLAHMEQRQFNQALNDALQAKKLGMDINERYIKQLEQVTGRGSIQGE